MGIRSFITDGNGTGCAADVSAIVNGTRSEKGLIVQTDPYRLYDTVFLPFLNDTFGNAMNQNAGFTGTPVLIHDGTDTGAWTGSNIVGNKVIFNSGLQSVSPTQSVYANSPNLNNIWEFDRGSDLDLSSYTAITMQIYIDARWTVGDSVKVYGWDTGTGTQVGDAVLLEDYINEFVFDEWQPAVIPLTDMALGVSTIDAIRFEQVGTDGQSAQFFMDDLQIEETGGSITFTVIPDTGRVFYNTGFLFTLAGPLNISVTNGTAPGLSYDKLLGLNQLTNGLTITRVQDGVTKFSFSIRDVGTWLSGGAQLTNLMCDGTNTYFGIISDLPQPVILSGASEENFISITVNDDMSSLLRLTGIALGYEEVERDKITN